MANTVNFVGYSRASGRVPFLRVYAVSFSGSYVQNNAEIINLNTANNPNGLEDNAGLTTTTPFVPPLILGSNVNGFKPELQLGGNGTAGEYGITFWGGGGTADTTGQMAAGTYAAAGFPANGANYGQVLIGVMTAE